MDRVAPFFDSRGTFCGHLCKTAEPIEMPFALWDRMGPASGVQSCWGTLPWQPFFGFIYVGCTLAPRGEYDCTVRVRRRRGLMSKYFDHLLLFLLLQR